MSGCLRPLYKDSLWGTGPWEEPASSFFAGGLAKAEICHILVGFAAEYLLVFRSSRSLGRWLEGVKKKSSKVDAV